MEATLLAGRYRVLRRIGSGGTASVFLACDVRLEREVAVKRIHGAEVTAATAERLRREARIMASLRHPNLVAVYDMAMDGDDLLLVMEYVRGETLANVLAAGPLSWQRTLALLNPVAAALDHVHDEGVVHRDLKPPNILVGLGGLVKVADLGLATAAEITKITPPGAILGTPAYMAPEQARPGPATPAADIYALATIAYEALSGTLPRWGRTVLAILAQATQEPPPDLREHRPGTPPAVAEALMRAMSPAPEERQRSASQLLCELAAGFQAGASDDILAPPRPPRTPKRPRPRSSAGSGTERRSRRRPRLLATAALGLAGAVVVAALVAPTDRPRPGAPPATPPRAQATQSPSTPTPTATSSPAAATARRRTLSPTATVRAFYRRAARGDYAQAWTLAGPGMRRAFGNSPQRFRRELSSLRRIEFQRVAITARDDAGATVEIQSVATHENRVDRCTGKLRAVPGARGWLVEPAGVRCTST